MDLLLDLEGRDQAQTPQGWPVPVTGAEEMAQRVRLRLTVRRGSFRLDPELGSRLYAMPRGEAAVMERFAREAIEEALAPLTGVRLEEVSCRYDPAADQATVSCRFLWRGQALETEWEG